MHNSVMLTHTHSHSNFQVIFSIHTIKCHICKTEVFGRQTFKLGQENASQKIFLHVAEFSNYLDETSLKLPHLNENLTKQSLPLGGLDRYRIIPQF